MTDEIKWEGSATRANNLTVQHFEKNVMKNTFPEDYKLFLKTTNGGRPDMEHRTFPFGESQTRTNVNLLFGLNHRTESMDLEVRNAYWWKEGASKDLLFIGVDDGGSKILLVVGGPRKGEVWLMDRHRQRDDGSNPRVEWFDRKDMQKVSDDFTEFLDSLGPLQRLAA